MKKFIILLANSQRYFIHALRIAIFIILIIVGGLNAWSPGNYLVSGAGVVMIIMSVLILLGIWFHKIGLVGGLLLTFTCLVSFLISLIVLIGDTKFQEFIVYRLSGSWQLIIVMIAGLICASDSAKQIFRSYVLRMSK